MPVSLTLQRHVDFLASAGCTPVLLPLLPGVEEIVGKLDGLLLPGGPDVDPARYGATAHPKARGVSPGMDAAELALIAGGIDAGLPFLAICRGMQLLNVQRGGTLHQHVPEIIGHDRHCPETEALTYGKHRLNLEPGSRIAGIFNGDAPETACHHHQAVDQIGAGLVATGRAPDGIIETVEMVDYPFGIGVQWEAEHTGDKRLYLALAEAARSASPRAGTGAMNPAPSIA